MFTNVVLTPSNDQIAFTGTCFGCSSVALDWYHDQMRVHASYLLPLTSYLLPLTCDLLPLTSDLLPLTSDL